MPDMATVCQETTTTPPNMFGSRGAQGIGPTHSYYNHCGYTATPSHGQYGVEAYGPFQTSPPEQQSHLQHPAHGHQQQHHQQAWGYGVGVMGGARHGVLPDEWTQGYLVPSSHSSVQNAYNYQYRGQSSHGPLDYASSIQTGHNPDPQDLEGSPSPNSSSPGEPVRMGANNQGAKSLRAPYEWMKPSASLPQSGKTRTKDKYRVVYSDHQRLELEKEFHFSKYITIRRKAEIAAQLGLSERQVKIWFQNRRAKERKQNKKREEQVPIGPHGSSNALANSGHELQQRLHHSASHESNHHSFITKLELDEDKSSLHDFTCHSTTHVQGAGLSSHSATPTPISLHPNLYHSPNMTMSPIIMGRNHSVSAIGHYHDNLHTSTLSPTTTSDDVLYRIGSDNGGNMNLSGSSDSGVVSSH